MKSKLSFNQKFLVLNTFLALVNVVVALFNTIPNFWDRLISSKHLIGVVNSFDISEVNNALINVSFANTGTQDITVAELILVGFFSDSTYENITSNEYFQPEIEYFEIKPKKTSLNIPTNIDSEKIESVSISVDLETFVIYDPPVVTPIQISPFEFETFETTKLFVEFYPHESFRRSIYFCATRFISFSILITLLDLEGNRTVSFMPILYSCENMRIIEKYTDVVDLFDKTFMLREYKIPRK